MGCRDVCYNEFRWATCANVSSSAVASLIFVNMNVTCLAACRYEAQLEKDWKYIIEDSDSKVLVVATEAIYNKVKDYVGKVRTCSTVHCIILLLSLLVTLPM